LIAHDAVRPGDTLALGEVDFLATHADFHRMCGEGAELYAVPAARGLLAVLKQPTLAQCLGLIDACPYGGKSNAALKYRRPLVAGSILRIEATRHVAPGGEIYLAYHDHAHSLKIADELAEMEARRREAAATSRVKRECGSCPKKFYVKELGRHRALCGALHAGKC
jgi:hypothetical protein